MAKKYDFNDLIGIIDTLRGENGCPWDKEQTHKSLRESLLEEAYEVADAIDNDDNINLCEELGDILLHVVLHSRIAKENDVFTIEDVVNGIAKKMIYRHPHIFGESSALTADDVVRDWEMLKKKEQGFESQSDVLKSVPKALPSMVRAEKVQKKAEIVGFDFKNVQEVLDKVDEEVLEFKQELIVKSSNIEEEFGDVLFSLVNLSRKLKINPEIALTKSTEKFINRFERVEKSVNNMGKTMIDMEIEELDKLWNKVKNLEVY